MSLSATNSMGVILRPASEVSTLKPGAYLDVPFEEYLKLPALSNSLLCGFDRSPGFKEWNKVAPYDTEADSAGDLGTLVHTLVLEPESLADRYLVLPKLSMRKNEDKEKVEEYTEKARALGLIAVKQDIFKKAQLMADSMMAHPDMRAWLKAANGYSEVTILWRDIETGMLCKARCDRLVFVSGGAAIFDVKTIARIEKLNRWYVQDYGYDCQRQHYIEAVDSLGLGQTWFYFGFVSSALSLKRYPVRYVELSCELIAAAHEKQRERLNKYKQCTEFNSFTGAETI